MKTLQGFKPQGLIRLWLPILRLVQPFYIACSKIGHWLLEKSADSLILVRHKDGTYRVIRHRYKPFHIQNMRLLYAGPPAMALHISDKIPLAVARMLCQAQHINVQFSEQLFKIVLTELDRGAVSAGEEAGGAG